MKPARWLTGCWAALAVCSMDADGGTPREWRFDVSVDGRPIGEHRFVLREHDGLRELTSEADFRVRIAFFDAYRYEHRAQEWWRGDCLERIDARTEENGRRTRVTGGLDNGEFRLLPHSDALPLAGCVQTFAYWNPSILESHRLLNPQTGEYVEVKVMPMGREVIGGQPAERYRLLGKGRTPLEIDLWYTAAQDWVALESRTPEGRLLHYARK